MQLPASGRHYPKAGSTRQQCARQFQVALLLRGGALLTQVGQCGLQAGAADLAVAGDEGSGVVACRQHHLVVTELLPEEPEEAPVAEPAEVPAKLEAKPASGRDSRASSRIGRVIGSKPVVRMRGA